MGLKAEVKAVIATWHLSGMEVEAPLWSVLRKALQTFHHFLSSVGLNALTPFRHMRNRLDHDNDTSMSLPLVSKLKFLKMMLSFLSQRFICGILGSGGRAHAIPRVPQCSMGKGWKYKPRNLCEKPQGQVWPSCGNATPGLLSSTATSRLCSVFSFPAYSVWKEIQWGFNPLL